MLGIIVVGLYIVIMSNLWFKEGRKHNERVSIKHDDRASGAPSFVTATREAFLEYGNEASRSGACKVVAEDCPQRQCLADDILSDYKGELRKAVIWGFQGVMRQARLDNWRYSPGTVPTSKEFDRFKNKTYRKKG